MLIYSLKIGTFSRSEKDEDGILPCSVFILWSMKQSHSLDVDIFLEQWNFFAEVRCYPSLLFLLLHIPVSPANFEIWTLKFDIWIMDFLQKWDVIFHRVSSTISPPSQPSLTWCWCRFSSQGTSGTASADIEKAKLLLAQTKFEPKLFGPIKANFQQCEDCYRVLLMLFSRDFLAAL